jgi:hypothetical protein
MKSIRNEFESRTPSVQRSTSNVQSWKLDVGRWTFAFLLSLLIVAEAAIASSFTISCNPASPPVGLSTLFTLTRVGGTAWPTDGTAFLSITPSDGATVAGHPLILSYETQDGITAIVSIFVGDTLGSSVSLTDTVNSVTEELPAIGPLTRKKITGHFWYVAAGGFRQPKIPQPITQHGAAGTTTLYYQIIANGAGGIHSEGFPSVTSPDVNVVAKTTLSNATLSGSNYNLISWTGVPGATSYDVLKWTGSAWASCTNGLAVTATVFADKSNTTAAYVTPSTNTTSLGNDSAAGTSWATAFATVHKAASVASAGDAIIVGSGAVCESTYTVLPCSLYGAGMNVTQIWTAINNSSSTPLIIAPSVGEIADLEINVDKADGTDRFPFMANATQGDCVCYRVKFTGQADSIYSGQSATQMTFIDCVSQASYDNIAVSDGGTAYNFIRHQFISNGNSAAALQSARGASIQCPCVLRECNVVATGYPAESQTLYGLDLAPGGGTCLIYNTTAAGPGGGLLLESGTLVSFNLTAGISNTSAGTQTANSEGVPVPDSLTAYSTGASFPNGPVGTSNPHVVNNGSGVFGN